MLVEYVVAVQNILFFFSKSGRIHTETSDVLSLNVAHKRIDIKLQRFSMKMYRRFTGWEIVQNRILPFDHDRLCGSLFLLRRQYWYSSGMPVISTMRFISILTILTAICSL